MVHITACFLFQILEQIEYGEQFPEDLVYRSFEMFLRIFEFFSVFHTNLSGKDFTLLF